MAHIYAAILFLLLTAAASPQGVARPLRIYFIDVDGGQATLVATPSGETLLIDAGWEERDAQRIAETARAAGITAIDFLLVTHFHRDHVGGVAALAGRDGSAKWQMGPIVDLRAPDGHPLSLSADELP